jgi:steroid 5-alpha reductase family enzyme
MNALPLILLALAGLCLLFAALYLLARRLDNYGIVDIAWSWAFAVLVIFYAVLAPGWPARKALIATMAGLWSLRLGTHLYRRVMGHHPVEDGRYVQLRRDWAGNFAPKMFGFFQLQAASVVLLGAAFLVISLNPAPRFHPLEIAGAALWLLALAGESLADHQLAAFKRDPANKGRVCAAGLWRYSRHPNYFFEWLVWVAYAVFAFGSPQGWVALIGPASILFLLLRVTGIPLTEEQAVRSKGDAYRRYQQTTSAFIPWLPRTTPVKDAK